MMTMMTIVASVLVTTVETMTTMMMMTTTGTIATMTMTTTDGVAPAQEGVDVTMMTINSNFLSQL